jgi:tetratricopeptide (TPR) repeat protein/DNA-binding XRE family transcriptional regulator
MAVKRPRLVQRRRVAGYSQEALANALRVERSTIVRWESGDTRPQPWLRPALARALRVSLDELDELLNQDDNGDAGPDPAARPEERTALLPAAGAAEAPPVCQLPPAVADFTGREAEITQLTYTLTSHDGERIGVPIAVIAGLPGAGKTALALQVAHRVRGAFPDGQLWVPLEGATGRSRNPGEVLGELIRALGVPGAGIPASTAERAALYRSRLAERRVLVLADDAASAAQVQPLLPGTGLSAVLVTSRSGLAGPPGSRLIQLDPLTQAESVQLLSKIVGSSRIAAEPEAAAALAAACGQLPLAVRIAAARLAVRTSWQLSGLARKITHARRRLDEFQSGDMSVRASLTQAYQALNAPAQRAFRRLALLDTAEFSEWQLAALLGAEDAGEVVNRLADSSLLTAVGFDAAGQPRYRLHDLLHEYATERLGDEPADEQEAARGRVTDGWLQLAARADARLPGEPFFPPPDFGPGPAVISESLAKDITGDATAWFTTERLALLAVIERCCSSGRHGAAGQLAWLLASFQHHQGRLDDAERTWRMITAAAEQAGDPAATAGARLRLAVATCSQGRHVQASPLVDQCVTAFEELGDRSGLAVALYWHTVCEWNLGDFGDARHSAQRAIELARGTGDRQTEALALRLLALATANLDQPHRDEYAVASAEKALALARQLDGPASFEHEVRHTVATVYSLVGRHEDALHLGQQGLAEAERFGAHIAIADWLGILGDAYRGLGQYREALESLRGALPMYRDQFMRRHHGLCLLKMGYTYQAMGDHQAAADHLQESLEIFRQLQLDHYAARVEEALRVIRSGPPAT